MTRVVIVWIRTLCLSIWIGGIGVIGAIVAPVAFRHSDLTRAAAGRVVGESLYRFNTVCYVAAALLLLCEVADWAGRRSRACVGLNLTRAVLSAVLIGLTFYLGFGLAPRMRMDQATGDRAAFDRGHHFYDFLARVEFGTAAAIAFLAALSGAGAIPVSSVTQPIGSEKRLKSS